MNRTLSRFLIGPIRRLSRVIRYATRLRLFDENVATHSYYVLLYSTVLTDMLKKLNYKVDFEKVILRALFHDADESVSGDIIRIFRNKLGKDLEALSLKAMSYILQDLPNLKTKEKYLKEWTNKFRGLEGLIVRASDDLSGLVYCKEQLDLGNKAFEAIYDSYYAGLIKLIKDTPLAFLEETVKKIKEEKFIDNQ